MRHFFVPDKEKCEAFLRAQKKYFRKTVQREKPDCGFAEADPPKGAKRIQSCYVPYPRILLFSYSFLLF
jgi:hypothetical protein